MLVLRESDQAAHTGLEQHASRELSQKYSFVF